MGPQEQQQQKNKPQSSSSWDAPGKGNFSMRKVVQQKPSGFSENLATALLPTLPPRAGIHRLSRQPESADKRPLCSQRGASLCLRARAGMPATSDLRISHVGAAVTNGGGGNVASKENLWLWPSTQCEEGMEINPGFYGRCSQAGLWTREELSGFAFMKSDFYWTRNGFS